MVCMRIYKVSSFFFGYFHNGTISIAVRMLISGISYNPQNLKSMVRDKLGDFVHYNKCLKISLHCTNNIP